jgi:hypothetical protein
LEGRHFNYFRIYFFLFQESMFVLAIVTVLFPSCFGQMQSAMWNGVNGGNAGGMAGGTAGSGGSGSLV